MLYPLKFKPRLKERIWGGDKLLSFGRKLTSRQRARGVKIGESWDISGVDGDLSVVSNGFLKGNNLQELVEVYMGDLVGDAVYERYGLTFPVLVKLLDAQDTLSIQVHPDDRLAEERHGSYGKNELWYIVECQPGAAVYIGFKRKVTREEFIDALSDGTLPRLLNRFEVKVGDCYFIPAGTIHAIDKGTLIAEVQQTSDITYRVFDWNRVDADGKPRLLHTALAVDAIDFDAETRYDITVPSVPNRSTEVVSCSQFTANLLEVEGETTRDYAPLDSFVIYTAVKGNLEAVCDDCAETLVCGESLLIPATQDAVTLRGHGKVLEIYVGRPATMPPPDREETRHEACGCGHEHYHDHEACGCGHEHYHGHEACGCGHDRPGHEEAMYRFLHRHTS